MAEIRETQPAAASEAPQGTWNSPDQIARHRAMTPQERLHKAIALSQAALRFSRAERVDGR